MSSPSDVPRPGPWSAPARQPDDELATRLAAMPVAGHVDVLAAEHERLHRLLATIDQL